jgi:hypothetical protein
MTDQRLRLDQPVTYQIRVQGRLDGSWSAWFDSLSIVVTDSDGSAPVTIITSRVKDQAALHGLLARIRDLGLPLLSVQYLDTAHDENP